MSRKKDIDLRNIKIEFGSVRLKVEADIYFKNIKVAELIDDGWCDEMFIEFLSQEDELKFKKRLSKSRLNKLLISNKVYSVVDIRPGIYQLSFLI